MRRRPEDILRNAARAALRHLRALFLLDRLPPAPKGLDETLVRAKVEAARPRLKAAHQLLNRGQTVASLVLFRDAGRLLMPSLRALHEHEQRPIPPDLEQNSALLTDTETALADQMSPEAALAAAEGLERGINVAIALLHRPTEQQRGVQRRLRFAVLALVVLLSLAGGVAYATRLRNLARGRPTAASGIAFGATPDRAVDGIRYGRIGFHSGGSPSDWWSVDLGRAYKLERVEAYGRADCCFDQSIPLAFEISLDGKAYEQVATRTEIFRQTDPWVIPGAGRVARFVRFRVLRKTYLVLGEVEVYGRPAKTRPPRAPK
jgi:hypothetical protein